MSDAAAILGIVRGTACASVISVVSIIVSGTASAQTSGRPFVVESNSGDNLLQIDVLAQFDGRFAVEDDSNAVADTFTETFTVGVNWYLNPFIKYVFNVERTAFDDHATGARPAENALVGPGSAPLLTRLPWILSR